MWLVEYKIRFKSDELLDLCGLEGHEWALLRTDDRTTLLLRESSRAKSSDESAAILEAAWEAYRRLANG